MWPRIGLRDGTVPVRAIAEVALSARNQGLPGRTRRSTHRNDNPPAANAEPHRETDKNMNDTKQSPEDLAILEQPGFSEFGEDAVS